MTSNIVQVTGIDAAAAISITGAGSPQYRICSDATCSTAPAFTATAGTVSNLQYVQLQQTASGGSGVLLTVTITVGTVSAGWDATTINGSVYSDSFSNGVASTGSQCTAMNNWRASLTTNGHSTIIIYGSRVPGGYSCTGSGATQLCNALKASAPIQVFCNGKYWTVDSWGSGNGNSILVSETGYYGGSPAHSGASCGAATNGGWVRPCIVNTNWGGLDGNVCSGASQTMNVVCQ